MDPVLNYINGIFQSAASNATLDTVNPATGQVITTLPRSCLLYTSDAADE